MVNYIIERCRNNDYSNYYRSRDFKDVLKCTIQAAKFPWYQDSSWRIKLGNKILFYVTVNGEILLKEN
jgi:hypothetical protein